MGRCFGQIGPRTTGAGTAVVGFQKKPLDVVLHNAQRGAVTRLGNNRVALRVVGVGCDNSQQQRYNNNGKNHLFIVKQVVLFWFILHLQGVLQIPHHTKKTSFLV